MAMPFRLLLHAIMLEDQNHLTKSHFAVAVHVMTPGILFILAALYMPGSTEARSVSVLQSSSNKIKVCQREFQLTGLLYSELL